MAAVSPHVAARKLVLALTQESEGSPEDRAALEALLRDPSSIDTVYEKIIARVLTDVSKNPRVVEAAVSLLAFALKSYIPAPATLRKLDVFCRNIPSSHSNLSSLALQTLDLTVARIDNLLVAGVSQEQAANASVADVSVSLNTSRGLLSSLAQTSEETLIANVMETRTAPSVFPIGRLPSGVLLRCAMFGAHVPIQGTANDPVVLPSEAVKCDIALESVKVVSELKKSDASGSGGRAVTLRRQAKLFQYIFYQNQTPLGITETELHFVVESILHPPELSARVLASKVLLKVIIDILVAREPTSTAAILSILLELVSSPDMATRVHAFTLVFNLSVHLNLLVECYVLADGTSSEDPRLLSNRAIVEGAQRELYSKLCELLLVLMYNSEKEERVATAALSTLLFFISKNGLIVKPMLQQLDPRVVSWFLTNLKHTSVEVERALVRMFVNIIYQENDLDVPALLIMSGYLPSSKLTAKHLFFVCDLYRRVRSTEAKASLFTVLFDAIVYSVQRNEKAGVKVNSEQTKVVYELLRRSYAHIALVNVFTFLPHKFVETFVRYIFFEQLRKDPAMKEVAHSLDKTLIVTLLYDFEKLAFAYQNFHSEFNTLYQRLLTATDVGEQQIAVFDALLSSHLEEDVRNGVALVFGTLRAGMDGKATERVADKINRYIHGLLASPHSHIRALYVTLTEKVLLYHKDKIKAHDSPQEVSNLMRFLSDRLVYIMTVQETSETNLLATFNMMFNLIIVPADSSDGVGEVAIEDSEDDSNVARYLRAEVIVPTRLLADIAVAPLQYMFAHIVSPRLALVRSVLLALIVHKCSDKAVLEAIGGIKFFQALLDDLNPHVSYIASRYLVAQLSDEKPERYEDLLKRVREKCDAEVTNEIFDNTYFQIRAILDQRKKKAI